MMNIKDVQDVVQTAIGGMNISESVEGLERYPINLRYPQDWRSTPEQLEKLPVVTPSGAHIPLGAVSDVKIVDGPGMIRSENARPTGFVFIDIEGRDLGGYVSEAQQLVASKVKIPAGYSITWSGQYEYIERVQERLLLVAPVTLLVITLMLFLAFNRLGEVAIILTSLPIALTGGIWFVYVLGFDLSVAVLVGFIALAGVAVETAIVMLLYLNLSWDKRIQAARLSHQALTSKDVLDAVVEGASAPAAKDNDGCSYLCRVDPHNVWLRDRFGDHEAHRGPHGGRHDHRHAANTLRHSGNLCDLEKGLFARIEQEYRRDYRA